MTTSSSTTTWERLPETEGTVTIRAHRQSTRRMGHWTTARRFDVRASQSSVIPELPSPRIALGDIELNLDIDRSMVKLVGPDATSVDADDLRRVDRRAGSDGRG